MSLSHFGVRVEFNAPPDTIYVAAEADFKANHLTDTDKQNSTGKYTNKYKTKKAKCKTKLPWFSHLLWHLVGNKMGLFFNAPKPIRGKLWQKIQNEKSHVHTAQK